MMIWTDEESNTLIQLWREGRKGIDIAKLLGKSRGAVMGRISRLREEGVDLQTRPRPPRKKRVYPSRKKPKPRVLESAPVVRPIQQPVSIFTQAKDVPYGEPCDILSLRFFSCRYIVEDNPTMYCNHMVHKHSYCEKHFHLCYQAGTNVPLTAKPRPAYRNS